MNLTRLEQAFVVLGRCNILAVHDCECCSTCAHARLSGELMARPELKGYVYYHVSLQHLRGWQGKALLPQGMHRALSAAGPKYSRAGWFNGSV